MGAREFNFDGIVGPTHNFSGLSYGNIASTVHGKTVSSPRAAALQGLEKMKTVADMGIGQAVLPPLHRPRLDFLRAAGFRGSDAEVVNGAFADDPVLLAAAYSASNMWTANAATVSPSADCSDSRLHLTPANLASTLHRSLEPVATTQILRSIFADESEFAVHDPLLSTAPLADEGAANHTRLVMEHGEQGIELFVYGHRAMRRDGIRPVKFPARQTLESVQMIARRHGLDPQRTMFIQQSPAAIDAGVFHNDVISVGHRNVLLCHEHAFVNQAEVLNAIQSMFQSTFNSPLYIVEFSSAQIPLEDAVSSYLFNSQLVTRPDGGMTLVCPLDCRETESAYRCTRSLIEADNPVDEVSFLDLRQSMNNGGGPACLRLRVVLTESQQSAVHRGVILTDSLYQRLVDWVRSHYREQLAPDDLADPALIGESAAAMKDLAGILELPAEVLLNAYALQRS